MSQMRPSEEQRDDHFNIEEKLRKIFLGSLLLNILVVIHLFYLAGTGSGFLATVRSLLPAVLLWSLMVTAYAFHALWEVSVKRRSVISMAFTDTATGVYSLSYLTSYLERERERVRQTGRPAAVAYLDLINLDRVNHSFGHAVGDIVLKSVAQLIADNIRQGDIVGRVGGDEFLVVMPETPLPQAESLLANLRSVIAGYRLDLGKRGTIDFLGCKIGLAAFPIEGGTPADIIQAAREKLQ